MHQIILVNIRDVKDLALGEAQPMLYFLSLALIGSGFLMIIASLGNFMATSKENLLWLTVVMDKLCKICINHQISVFIGHFLFHRHFCIPTDFGIFWRHLSFASSRGLEA